MSICTYVMPDNPYKIYSLTDPRDQSIRYIGCTCQALYMRLQTHLSDVRHPTNSNLNINGKRYLWIKELLDSNIKPIINLIEIVGFDKSLAKERERHYICLYQE